MGIGALLSLAIVAAISNLVDPRIQVVVGLVACAAGSWMLGFSTASTGLENTWLPLGLVGFGAGGSMLPVMISGFAAIKTSQAADGSAQMGLGRQLGGSFGIAIINTHISQMTDFHRAMILQHLILANQTFTHDVYRIAGMMMAHGYHGPAARNAALALIEQQVGQQSAIMGSNSAFQLVALMFFCCLPLVLLLKAPRAGAGDRPTMH